MTDLTLRGALLPKPTQSVRELPCTSAGPLQASLAMLAWLQGRVQGSCPLWQHPSPRVPARGRDTALGQQACCLHPNLAASTI